MREVMKKVKDLAKTEKEVMTCAEVKAEMAKSDDGFEDDDRLEENVQEIASLAEKPSCHFQSPFRKDITRSNERES